MSKITSNSICPFTGNVVKTVKGDIHPLHAMSIVMTDKTAVQEADGSITIELASKNDHNKEYDVPPNSIIIFEVEEDKIPDTGRLHPTGLHFTISKEDHAKWLEKINKVDEIPYDEREGWNDFLDNRLQSDYAYCAKPEFATVMEFHGVTDPIKSLI